MTAGDSQLAEEPTGGAVARLECDAFCTCGYNLYLQAVVKDGRLGLHLVRCPECGQWHPAGHGATAASVWMTRLAKVLLIAWMLLLLASGMLVSLIQWGLNLYAHDAVFRAAAYRYNYSEGSVTRYVFFVFPALLGVFSGLVQAVGMWHLSGAVRFLPMMLVLTVAGLFSLASVQDYSGPYRELAVFSFVITSAVTGLAWTIISIVGGAPARWLARLLIPPGPRQYLSFLWHAEQMATPELRRS